MKHKIYKHKDDGTIFPSNSTSSYGTGTIFIATETAACCRYGHGLVMFNGGCYKLLYSTINSSFEFWLHQAYHVVSQIADLVLLAVSNVRFFDRILLSLNDRRT